MNIYYVGKDIETYNTSWNIQGIFSSLELAFDAVSEGEFIVEVKLNEILPKGTNPPEVFWWKVDGVITDSNGDVCMTASV